MYSAQLMQAVDTCLNGLAVLGGDVVDRDRVAVLLGHRGRLGHLESLDLSPFMVDTLKAPARPGLSFTLCVSAGTEPGGKLLRWLGGHDRPPSGSWPQAPARRRTHAAGRGTWPARRSIKSFVYNDPAELERADDLVVQRPIAGKNHAD